MKATNQASDKSPMQTYRIIVRGHLHPRWSEWFEHMTITHQPDGTTLLKGVVPDRAALYGLLNKLRDMGFTLLLVEAQSDEEEM